MSGMNASDVQQNLPLSKHPFNFDWNSSAHTVKNTVDALGAKGTPTKRADH